MPSLPSCSDYTTSIVVPNLIKAPQLQGGSPELYKGKPVKYAGGFCIVFPFVMGSRKLAVRCWHASLEGARERCKIISDYLQKSKLPYFVDFEYVERGIATSQGIQPIVIMDWVNAKPLKLYIEDNLYNSDALRDLAEQFLKMTQALHNLNISHGDLQHGNILVNQDGTLVLVDYDSMYVPALAGWKDIISGQPGYQHPARWDNAELSPKADYFSEMVIYTSLIALSECPKLWEDLDVKNTDTMLFSNEDLKSKGESTIFHVISTFDDCADLVEQMKDALNCTSIEQIAPLNVNKISIAEGLSEKWNDNGYRPQPVYDDSSVKKITRKW